MKLPHVSNCIRVLFINQLVHHCLSWISQNLLNLVKGRTVLVGACVTYKDEMPPTESIVASMFLLVLVFFNLHIIVMIRFVRIFLLA